MRKILVLTIALVCLETYVFGQQMGCGGIIPPECADRCTVQACNEDPTDCERCVADLFDGVPIDGGLSWLLLAGAGLAGNHIRKKRKKRMAGVEVK